MTTATPLHDRFPEDAMPVTVDEGRAWRSGQDTVALLRSLFDAHDHFLATGRAGANVRPLVAKSWRRCLDTGVDPEAVIAPVELAEDDLAHWRDVHPLAPVMPVIRRLLLDDAVESGLVVAVSDARGRLLWVEGQARALGQAERIHFVEGSCWSEDVAGTNAPGTALALDQPVQIFGAEHLSRSVTPWSCTAAPIHDPDSGQILGVLDLTGGNEVAAPRTLSLVRATVTAVESELRVRRMLGVDRVTVPAPDRPVLRTLGLPAAALASGSGAWGDGVRLGQRHSELLLLLAAYPDGIGGERLATLLREHDVAAVTLRAEISRLRAILAPLALHSRPYRLSERLAIDADDVRALLIRGEVAAAVEMYVGPVLPTSQAPGVVELRDVLHARIRSAVLDQRDPVLLLRFADTDHSRLDWQLWRDAAGSLPDGSVRQQVRAHLRYLDRRLA